MLQALEIAYGLVLCAIAVLFVRSSQMQRRRSTASPGRGGLLSRIPVWMSVVAVAVGAAAGWLVLDRASMLPRVFGDELVYSGLAKSIARGDGLTLSGVAEHGYGLLYPVVISPAYALAGNGAAAYAWVKAADAAIMSLVAIPSYLIARRVVSHASALAVAALTVALPSMAYTTLVMTEPLFYPGFLLVALAFVRALERRTIGRQLAAMAELVLLAGVRVQAVSLAGALLTAAVLFGASGGSIRATFRRLLPAWVCLALAVTIALAVTRGDPRAVLGSYGVLIRSYGPLSLSSGCSGI